MKKPFLLLAFIMGSSVLARAQQAIPSRVNIGLNLAGLYSGLPELQAAVFLHRYVGIAASVGYKSRPTVGGIKVGTYDKLTESKGAYFKAGITGRFVSHSPKRHRAVPWLRVLYVYSEYDDYGYYEPPGTPRTYRHYEGSLNAWAIALGADFPIWKGLDLTLGHQLGFYKRTDHFDNVGNVFQAGLGAEFGMIQMGINYRIGRINEKKASK